MPGLRPLRGRALWAIVAIVATIVTDLVAVWADLLDVDLMDRLIDGENVPEDELRERDDRQSLVGLLQLAVLVVSVFFFIRWFHASYSNLPLLGQPNLRYRTGWAIGAWFVPFLNLWRPKSIANDIWRGSAPDAPEYAREDWGDAPVTPLLHVWWAAWILTSIVAQVAGRAWWRGDTPEDLKNAAQLDMASSFVNVVAAVLAIAVIRALTSRQEQRTRRIATMPPTPPQPAGQGYTERYDSGGVTGSSGEPG